MEDWRAATAVAQNNNEKAHINNIKKLFILKIGVP